MQLLRDIMRLSDYHKYGTIIPHIFRLTAWKLAGYFDRYPQCIDCLEKPCNGKYCFGKVRKHLKSIGKLPKPDGYLNWNRPDFQKAVFPKKYHPLSTPPRDWNLLKILRDGRSGSLMQEYAFKGRKNPYNGAILQSDGTSHPADCWERDNPEVIFEVKSFTSAAVSLTLKSSGETGVDRSLRQSSTLEGTILGYDYWILVDRTELYNTRMYSLPFYFLKSDDFLFALRGSYTSDISNRDRMYVNGELQVPHYESVLRIIHRAKNRHKSNLNIDSEE